jgi:amidase
MNDALNLDATAQLAALADGRFSARDLLEAAVERADATQATLNAVVVRDIERARRDAEAVDEARVRGRPLARLAGLPMTIKDTLDVQSMPASSGLRSLLDRAAPDAATVARARAEGAVIWGKTNVPVMAGDWQSFNALYGVTNNPWDGTRTPGGSSGGAAAAVAAGITALEIGSDIGGSLRVPASFCGVFSHKPTYGLVPQRGHVPPRPGRLADPDLNVVGPIARSVRDLRLLLSVVADCPVRAAPPPLGGLRVALWLEEPTFFLDPEVRAALDAFAGRLGDAGAAVTAVASPVPVEPLMRSYRLLLSAQHATDLSREQLAVFEAVRRRAEAGGADASSAAEAFSAFNYAARHHEWMEAHEARLGFAAEMARFFQRFDVLVAPVSPTAAFPHDHRPFNDRTLQLSDERAAPYDAILDWIALATACGLPATCVPAGLTAGGLPVGVQLIGPHGSDDALLAIAESIERQLGGWRSPNFCHPGRSEAESRDLPRLGHRRPGRSRISANALSGMTTAG